MTKLRQRDRSQKAISVRERYVPIASVLFCYYVGGIIGTYCDDTTKIGDKSRDISLLPSLMVTDTNHVKEEHFDEITAEDMIMFGIGVSPGFGDMSKNAEDTINMHTTSENSLAGLSSIDYTTRAFDDTLTTFNTSSNSSHAKEWFHTKLERKWKCGHLTIIDDKAYSTISVTESCRFWTEGIVSLVVAVFGLLGNLVSIWVLSVEELRKFAFNRLLLALAMIDCMFIIPGMVIYTEKAFSWQADWYHRIFPVFLYPFSEIALCSSIYMTVAIAVERYIGLCRPFQRLSGRPCSAKAYVTPVVLIALILNIPKFLESETIFKTDKATNTTTTNIGVTGLRLHPDYITYYLGQEKITIITTL